MVIATLGGGPTTPCVSRSCACRVHTRPFHAARSRLYLSRQRKQSNIVVGDPDAAANVPLSTRQAYALASDTTAVPGADLRSADLEDMCTLQLGMLYQLLSRAGTNYSSMKCTVYARNFMSVGPGQVKLVRVAHFPVDPGQGEDSQTQQQLLLHTEQSWALQGGSAAVDPCAMIEECLLHREVVALPSSSSLVFPLVDCGVLVGLLVVTLEKDRDWDREKERLANVAAGGASGGGGGRGAPPGGGGSEAGDLLLPVVELPLSDGCGAALVMSDTPPVREHHEGSCQVQVPTRSHNRILTDEELQCLRLAVPLLAKACGMDARAGWQLAQSSVTAATARGLLREAQRPLSTLNTFGTMLVPRLKDGDPDKDMAKGILVQGKRLQDLIWQLEDALHGPAVLGASTSLGPAAAPPQQLQPPLRLVATPGMAGGAPAAALQVPPFLNPSTLPRSPSPAVQELLSLPQPRPAALPAAAVATDGINFQQPLSQQQQREAASASASISSVSSLDAAPVEGSLQFRSMDATVGPSDLEGASPWLTSTAASMVHRREPAAAVLPGRVTFVDRTALPDAPCSSSSSSSSPGSSATANAFTLRKPPPMYAVANGRASAAAVGLGAPSAAAGLRHGGRLEDGSSASTATIDVEMDNCDAAGSSSSSSKAELALAERSRSGARQPAAGGINAGRAAWSWVPGAAHLSGMGVGGAASAGQHMAAAAPTAVVSTNLASALAGVLTAAYRLAAVSGIGFIVNSPLSAVLPSRRLGAPSTGGKTPSHPVGKTSSAAGSSGAGAGSPRSKMATQEPASATWEEAVASAVPDGSGSDLEATALVAAAASEPRLIPRPARPLRVGVPAALLQRVVGFMLDIALQCTPRGGQVCVSARQDGAGVQVQVLHSGRMDPQRLHVRSRSMMCTSSPHAPATNMTTAAAAARSSPGAVSAPHGSSSCSGRGAAVAVATRPAVGTAPVSSGGRGFGAQVGSGVLSVEMAQELAHQAGGHLTMSYPFNMVNAKCGSLDVGTSVEIWLPGPGELN